MDPESFDSALSGRSFEFSGSPKRISRGSEARLNISLNTRLAFAKMRGNSIGPGSPKTRSMDMLSSLRNVRLNPNQLTLQTELDITLAWR